MCEGNKISGPPGAFLMPIFFILISFATSAQSITNPPPLETSFVKNEIIQKKGALSFNVVRIRNNTDKPIAIRPILDIPEGWAIYTTSFVDTVVPAHTFIALPFRFKTSSTAKSTIKHLIRFKAFSAKNNILIENSFTVVLEKYHNWDVFIPDKRVFFYPRMNSAKFEVMVINNGNTNEHITLDIKPDAKITLESNNLSDFVQQIDLPPNSDTIINFEATYVYSENRVFDISKVNIYASTEEKKLFRSVIIEKYTDTYEPFKINYDLLNEAEVGVRTFLRNRELLPFVRARGIKTFKSEAMFKYNFTYYNLMETENLVGNTYYNFLYQQNEFKVGLGAFSSQLGRNLYSRNGIMISDIIKLSPSSGIEGFASYSIINPKASFAAAYHFDNDRVNMQGSLSFDIDKFNKVNTISAIFSTGKIKLSKNHQMNAVLYGYDEKNYFKNSFHETGFAWDVNYLGRINKKLSLQLSNIYGSPDIPGPQKGLLTFFSRARYNIATTKNYFTVLYLSSSRNYYNRNGDGVKLPNIHLKDQYASIFFNFNASKKVRWYIGPSIEFYYSSRPTSHPGERLIFNINKYRMEYKSFFGRHFMLNAKYGVGLMYFQGDKTTKDAVYDFHLLTSYSNNGYGVRLSYDYGPMVNMGLYQYALDMGNNSINFAPYLIKSYVKNWMHVSLFTNLSYKFDLQYGSVNVNPKIETYIFKDWYVSVGGNYTYTTQTYSDFTTHGSFYYLEFSIKKKWGKRKYDRWKNNVRRLKIQLFQDENGNGMMDNNEARIPHVKVRLQLRNAADQSKHGNLPVDITLLSNKKGIVTFNQIPQGFYKLSIIPMTDMQQYFYINKSAEDVELIKNTFLKIPFEKASKIEGRIEIKRQRFSKNADRKIEMANVKVTAFNNAGDSYSSFTLHDGSFVIFAPGHHLYHLRIQNVFGREYRIVKNDISVSLTDTTNTEVVFKVVEMARKINFKKATPVNTNPAAPKLQKIKVLPGKIYKNGNERNFDKNKTPDFNMPQQQIKIHQLIPFKYYIVAEQVNDMVTVKRVINILFEQGLDAKVGTSTITKGYYIYLDYFSTRSDARKKIKSYTGEIKSTLDIIMFDDTMKVKRRKK